MEIPLKIGVMMSTLDKFLYRNQPGFNEAAARENVLQALPIRTIVTRCFDPRADGIPAAVAEYLGDEIYPGESVYGDNGKKLGSTATIIPVVVGGGRALEALTSITGSQYLFGLYRVVVVHHSFCGATAMSAEGLCATWKRDHGSDISGKYDWDSVFIYDFEESLRRDVEMVRANPGTPAATEIYGLFYDIDNSELKEIVRDVPGETAKGAEGE